MDYWHNYGVQPVQAASGLIGRPAGLSYKSRNRGWRRDLNQKPASVGGPSAQISTLNKFLA